jgi:hypothetical protein
MFSINVKLLNTKYETEENSVKVMKWLFDKKKLRSHMHAHQSCSEMTTNMVAIPILF